MRIHFSEYKIPYVCSKIPNTFLATSCAMQGNIKMMFCSCSCIVIMNVSHGGKLGHRQFRQYIIIIFIYFVSEVNIWYVNCARAGNSIHFRHTNGCEQPHIIYIEFFLEAVYLVWHKLLLHLFCVEHLQSVSLSYFVRSLKDANGSHKHFPTRVHSTWCMEVLVSYRETSK